MTEAAFLAMIADHPDDEWPRLVYADWLEERGECDESAAWRAGVTPTVGINLFSVLGFSGSGRGIGRGRGIGSGIGSGSGRGIGRGLGIGSGIGSGSGSGSGLGIGRGLGIGSGSGSGLGIGSGSGSGLGIGSGNLLTGNKMKIGSNYLIHCGDWHTYVGRCERQVGPMLYLLTEVSKISDTGGGDNWHELAANKPATARRRATYIHYTTPAEVPISIIAFEWVGDLPART